MKGNESNTLLESLFGQKYYFIRCLNMFPVNGTL